MLTQMLILDTGYTITLYRAYTGSPVARVLDVGVELWPGDHAVHPGEVVLEHLQDGEHDVQTEIGSAIRYSRAAKEISQTFESFHNIWRGREGP